MGELLRRVFGEIGRIIGGMSTVQKITLTAVSILTVVGLTLMVMWVRRPEYALLYSNLSPKDADQIVQLLDQRGIPYTSSYGGTAISVPAKRVYELRMDLAAQGIPVAGNAGYELFDKTNIGMSEFVQKLNYKRALEGELAKTIQGMVEIEQVRVHLVIPERRVFLEDQEEPSASVVLAVRPGVHLEKRQIRGIAHLVASSVEGLQPERVTIVDTYSHILSDLSARDSLVGLSSSQLELQRNVESYLAQKAQTMLEEVLGRGNAIVRVTAELNFERIERRRERYDPESAVVLSEERDETSGESIEGSPSGSMEHTITNYEINRTMEHVVNAVGTIRRLSVAVLVNGVPEGEDGTIKPRSAEEIARLRTIVQNAVGFDATRSDQIEVTSIPFDTSEMDRERAHLRRAAQREFWMSIAQKVLLGVLLVSLLLMLRSRLKRIALRPLLESIGLLELVPEEQPSPPALGEAAEEEVSEEVLQERVRKEKIAAFVQENPTDAARLLRSWWIGE